MRPAAAPRGAHTSQVSPSTRYWFSAAQSWHSGPLKPNAQYASEPASTILRRREASASLPAHRVLPALASPPKRRHSVSTAEEGLARQKPDGRTREERVVLSGQTASGGHGLQNSVGEVKMSPGSEGGSRR